MNNFIIKELLTDNIEKELNIIGFDSSYINQAADKYKYKTYKIYDLTLPQANIIKQTALSFGADCAVHRNVLTGNIDKTDVIIGGSVSQLKKISAKLIEQPFSLKTLSEILNSKILSKTDNTKTKLVGILNVTPDSFSDGGRYFNTEDAIKHIETLITDGADMIDIGAESTRPSAINVSAEEQIERLAPVLNYIEKSNLNIPISVDTRNSKVAEFALDKGIRFINDVSGFDYDNNMINVISKYHAGIIIQHSRPIKNSKTLIDEIYFSLKEKAELAISNNIENVILDVGIGFNKTTEENFEVINRIEEFSSLNYPMMLGVSRKSMLGLDGCCDNNIKDALTVAISYPLMLKRISYLRVHNVKLHKYLLNLTD